LKNTYGIDVDEPIHELTIRLFLMSRLGVETISGLENSADIYYSFDTGL
jgi:translocation and assembly module TamB